MSPATCSRLVDEDTSDDVAAQARRVIKGAVRGHIAAIQIEPVKAPAERPEPEHARGVLADGQDFDRAAVRRRNRLPLTRCAVDLPERAAGPDPQHAAGVRIDGVHQRLPDRLGIVRRRHDAFERHLRRGESVGRTGVQTDPDVLLRVLEEGDHSILGEALKVPRRVAVGYERSPLAIVPEKALAHCPEPDRPVDGLQNRVDAGEPRASGFPSLEREASDGVRHPVELCQAVA